MFLALYRSWSAQWIWPRNHRTPNAHALFRRDFELAAPPSPLPTRATLFLAVETFARVYLNGHDVLRTTSLSYPGQQHYEELDILPFLKVGTNQLAVVAWYAGIGTTATWLKDPGLLCELELVTPAGITRVGSDATWLALPLEAWTGEIRSPYFNLDFTEYLDLRKLPEGFPLVTDLAAFRPPHVSRWPGVRMGVVEPRPFPAPVTTGDAPIRLLEAGLVPDNSATAVKPTLAVSSEDFLAPLSLANIATTIAPPPAGQAVALVYYLGGYEKGHPILDLEAPANTVVDVTTAENLVNRHIDLSKGHPFTTDRYTLREGANRITAEEWKAGRYLQLTFRNFHRPLQIRELRWASERYPLPRRTRFASSDPRLDALVAAGLKSTDMCMHDRIMDCPWRERRQWIADIQRIALINHYAFGDTRLVRGVLRQHTRLQDPTGRMWVCMPLMEEYPYQSMEWVRAIVEYEEYAGDPTLREELADNVELLHRWFLRCRDAHGLFFNPHPPVLNWMDNPLNFLLKVQTQSPFLAMNLRYLFFLEDVALILRRSGHPAAAEQALEQRCALAERIPAAFRDPVTGLLRECANPALPVVFSELAAALAVRAELPDFDAAAHFDRYVAFAGGNPDRIYATSPFGKHETLEALGRLNRPADILAQLYAHWGPMVDAGSDTAWEAFSGSSVCHGWSGVPLVALMRHVLRADPLRPGTTRREDVGGVAWMECEVAGGRSESRL